MRKTVHKMHVYSLLVFFALLNPIITTAADHASIFESSVFNNLAKDVKAISGTVTDADGIPLGGVTVLEKGTSNGVVTDFDGNYSIDVANNKSTLVFSYVGFQTISEVVGDRAQVNIKMQPDTVALDDLIVVGYSRVSREELTSAVSSVGAEAIKDIPLNSAAEAIQGRLAGVQVTSTEGGPGADVQIRVRGGTSITQDNAPLYIVDGIQVENALSILSPQEIESVDVLKDAASTSIYGARGANGVVLITTKGGKAIPTQVTYSGYMGVRQIVNKLPVMNPYEFVNYQYELYNFPGDEALANTFTQRYGTYEDIQNYRNVPFQNWQDEVFGREAFNQTHNLSIIGGSEVTTFSLTMNHVEEEGIMLNSGYKRDAANFKFDHKINDKAKFGVNARYSRRKIDGAGTSSTGSQGSNRLRNAVRYQPFTGPGNENFVDEFDPQYATLTNLTSPVLLANNELQFDYRNDLILNSYFSYDIVNNLTFKSVIGYVQNDRNTKAFNGKVTSVARANADMPVVDLRNSQTRRVTNSNTLNYNWKINNQHRLDILVGQETVRTDGESERIYVKWLPENITATEAFAGIQRATPPAGQVQDPPSTAVFIDRISSFFGQVHYSFDKKYLATFSVRTDGSSVFDPDYGYATFPSLQLAWNAKKEKFLENVDWLDNLKIRASYGTSGNNRIEPFLYRTFFDVSSTNGYAFDESVTPGAAPPSELANPNVKWEKTISKNFGVDFSLFNDRLYGSIDAYVTDTDDLLLRAKIPQTSGYDFQFQNSGATRNKGIELALGGSIIETEDFRWNANLNVASNKNTIISLGQNTAGGNVDFYLESSGWVNNIRDFKVEVGKPIGQFFGYVTDGFYTVDDFNYDAATQTYTLKDGVPSSSAAALGSKGVNPGDLKLKDLDGNGVIGDEDKTVLGNPQPTFYGGLSQQFAYKNFDMSVFVNFSVGNKVYNANKVEFTSQYLYRDNNMLTEVNGRWRNFDDQGQRVTDPTALSALNENTSFWTPPTGQYILHSYAIEDGSFLRLSNITLGYSLPESVLNKLKVFSKFRFYVTANNLLTLTGYSGYDPEASTRRNNPLTPGVDYAAYPRSRFILSGVNITF